MLEIYGFSISTFINHPLFKRNMRNWYPELNSQTNNGFVNQKDLISFHILIFHSYFPNFVSPGNLFCFKTLKLFPKPKVCFKILESLIRFNVKVVS